jgi:hypothetical protein
MKLYATGGRQRTTLFKNENEWRWFERALIVRVDTETGKGEVAVEYDTPADARPGPDSSVCFKCGTVAGDMFYACTSTEVLVYQLPGFKPVGYVSLPCFNDVHHVTLTPDGNLLVVSTGLDMVVEVTPQGKMLREWSAVGEDPWTRFHKETDYRKVPSNKPYKAHPNFAFRLGTDLWVTRSDLKDAVCLTQRAQRIPINIECVHDGALFGGTIYFTTIDGNIVMVDPKSLRVVESVDLKTIDNKGGTALGFCRGVLPLEESRAWIGFTRFRQTKFKEKVAWVRHGLQGHRRPTRLALYDVVAKKCLKEINLEEYGMNAVFSILPEPC